MNLKVLRLAPWMKTKLKYECIIERITPIFHRDGYYKLGKKIWFEYHGEAYISDTYNMFDYKLKLLNHRPLRKIEKEALHVLIKAKLASKELIRLYYLDNEFKM